MNHDPGVRPDTSDITSETAGGKRPWVSPKVTELPRLTDLTLQTGGIIGDPIGGGGDTGGGGSTVF